MKLFGLALFVVTVSAQPVIESSLGKVSGQIERVSNIDVETFRGIPYAKPPTRELRFALPVPFGELGDFDATRPSTICPQPEMPTLVPDKTFQDEDCLKLNVYRKGGNSSLANKPVVIFIHGGGYSFGSGSDSFQTAISLAAYEDVIIVSPNYRLGILGFADMGEIAPGNLGLHDQRLAIKWVHDNIKAFGGDPKRVTLMGLSAGSMSIAAQVITPLNKDNLFQSVIMDAGVVNGFSYIEDADSSYKKVQSVAEKVNCSTEGTEMLQCLRKTSAQDLINESEIKDWKKGLKIFVATRDGTLIPRNLETYLKTNNFARVRMIVGYARNEGSMFAHIDGPLKAIPFPVLKTKEDFVTWIEKFIVRFNYPIDLKNETIKEKFVDAYYNKYPGTVNVTTELQSDGIFFCPINYYVKEFAKQHNNIFVYEFDRKLTQTYFGIFDPVKFGAFHYSPYLHFSGAALAQPNAVIPDADKKYFLDSMAMIGRFVSASDDSPPTFRGTQWPDYSKTGEILVFDETLTIRKGLTREQTCETFFVQP